MASCSKHANRDAHGASLLRHDIRMQLEIYHFSAFFKWLVHTSISTAPLPLLCKLHSSLTCLN